MRLLEEGAHQLACSGVVLAELGVVLVTVQFDEVEASSIRCPTDIGEVTVRGIARVQIDGLLRFGVVDAYGYLVARHACHRVADVVQFAYPCGDVYQWILRHHAFVHPVEGEQVTFRAPVGSFADAELVAVHTLATYNAFGFGGNLACLSVTGHYVEVVVECVGQMAAHFVPVFIGGLGGAGLAPN